MLKLSEQIGDSDGKESACNAGDLGLIPGLGRSPGILAWRIPWTEEPGGLWSTGQQRVDYIWASLVAKTVKNLPAMQETPV